MEADIKIFDSVDSTNTVLEKMAENGAKEGTGVVAFFQESGQGRSGRSFFSPGGGNLYMSLLLRPQKTDPIDMITVMAAAAVVVAIERAYGIKTGIKWVNDIIYNDRKVCGILARAMNAGTDYMYVIVGIGINIYEADDVPDEIKDIYGSLLGKCTITDDERKRRALDLAHIIADTFFKYYDGSDTDFMSVYKSESVVIGKNVSYICGREVLPGTVRNIADDGAIVIETAEGVKSFRDGEIRIKMS